MDTEIQAEKLAKAKKDVEFMELEAVYADAQAKVQSGGATPEEVAHYNDLANQIVELRQGIRGHRDRLKELEGTPEADGVATSETIHASVSVDTEGGE